VGEDAQAEVLWRQALAIARRSGAAHRSEGGGRSPDSISTRTLRLPRRPLATPTPRPPQEGVRCRPGR
jgi:hypothetical protein